MLAPRVQDAVVVRCQRRFPGGPDLLWEVLALARAAQQRDQRVPGFEAFRAFQFENLDARNGHGKNGHNAQQEFLFILNRTRCPRRRG
eukprot:345448-Pyramimonas_sp.AAC.1